MSCLILLCVVFLGVCGISNATVYYEPQQVHISTGSSDQMTIVWNTFNDTKDSRVLFGKTKQLGLEAVGARVKFVDGGKEKRFQFIHTVNLTGLAGDTVYYYMAGSKDLAFSEMFSFKTWPAGNSWSPSLVIFGDMGNSNAVSLPMLQVEAAKGMYDAALHVGDFAYNMFTDNARVGDEYMRQIEPLASGLPYMTCPGNHENTYNFSNYKNRFRMPGDINQRMYYSFKMGPVRVISTATEWIFYRNYYGIEPAVEHIKWLENELKDANKPENRAKQPWVITIGHRPMYCSNRDSDDCSKHESVIRTGIPKLGIPGWEQMFYENGVDVAIWAHEHSYERLWPVYNRTVMNGSTDHPYTNPKATVHITTGSAGCGEHLTPFNDTAEDWSAIRVEDYGFTRMKVFNSSHLYMEQVSADKGGAITDKVMIIKDTHGSFNVDRKPAIADNTLKWTKLQHHLQRNYRKHP